MDNFKALLILHIIGGSVSLLLGTFILARKKGDSVHRLTGNIYYYVMLITALVALPMSYLHTNYFLFIIAVFTSYMLVTGRRYIKKNGTTAISFVDWLLTLLMLIFALLFIALGIFNIVKGNIFGIVFIVFGSIGLLFVYQDYINFNKKSKVENFGLTTHLQRMIGSYVASATAFLVVNNKLLPGIIAWLLPTLIIVPLIIKWTRKYKILK
ncbi:hypothetical protein BH11BAC3_BH11BAC3_23780 [soil metagenome]